MKSKFFRAKARENLVGVFKSPWLYAALITLIFTAITSIAASIPVVPILIVGPLAVGLATYYLKLARGENNGNIALMFDGFKSDFGGNLLLGFMVQLFTALWTLLFIIPGIVKSYSYAMSYYIKVDHPEYSWRECINESRRIMNGNKWKLLCLDFSFIGWMILVILVGFGVGDFWLVPYQEASRANFYEQIKNN